MDTIVHDVRDMWSHAGVEVESASDNKVRCRMPPYFQGVQDFTQSLEHHGVVVDLETSMNGQTASVVFVIFAGAEAATTARSREGDTPRGWKTAEVVALLVAIVCTAMQMLVFAANWPTLKAMVWNATQ